MASFLVISMFATLAAYLNSGRSARSWWTAGAAISVGVQVAAIWFSGSRGPLLGVVVAAVVMALAGLVLLNRRQIASSAVAGAAAIAVAVVIVLLPAPESSGGRSGQAIVASILGQAAAATGSNVSLSNESLATDSVDARVDIWLTSLELLGTRDSVEFGGPYITFVRHVFGYGPEMFYLSYSLAAPTQSEYILASHAHNYVLQIWLEYGLLGFIALLGIVVSALLVLFQLAWRSRRGSSAISSEVLAGLVVGLLAILAARAVEQMPGVGRIADLTAFWAILALVFVVARFASDRTERIQPAIGGNEAQTRRVQPRDEYRPLWVGGAIGVGILALAFWGAVDGTALYASRLAAMSSHQFNTGDAQAGYELMKRAADTDRFSEVYGLTAAQLERNAANREEDRQQRLDTMLVAYSTLAEYEQTVPWAVNNDIRLTAVIAAIAELGVEQALGELGDRTIDLDIRMRPYPRVMAFVANSYVALGDFELGILVADYAIESAEAVGVEVSQAWWAKGEALGRLDGREEEALAALETAIEVDPDSEFAAYSHRTLAGYYEENGDPTLAAQHREMAEAIERALAGGA